MKIKLLVVFMLITIFSYAQTTHSLNRVTSLKSVENLTVSRGIPSKRFFYTISDNAKTFTLDINPDLEFSYFGIGFDADSSISYTTNDFSFKYRTLDLNNEWTPWTSTGAETRPIENKWHMFMTDILFTYDAERHKNIEVQFNLNANVKQLFFEFMDGKANSTNVGANTQTTHNFVEPDIAAFNNLTPNQKAVSTSTQACCLPFPTVIQRSAWCGGAAPCNVVNNQNYTNTIISPTHLIVHYGATPNTYSSGLDVVRSYWDFHVNSNGWSDMGYQYLIDKAGTIYQGRKNANMQGQDVQGAHALASNPYSIGVNFLGNTDVTLPTTTQINSFKEISSWWLCSRGFDPTVSSPILTSDYGTPSLTKIFGHLEAMSTSCPGTVLFGQLPSLRTQVKTIIDNCNTGPADAIAPTTAIATNNNWFTTDFSPTVTDADNSGGSGLDKCFYQVQQFNGTNWTANASNGFVYDEFNTATTQYSATVGTWSIAAGNLIQTDDLQTNTAFTIPVDQVLSNRYIFEWNEKFTSTNSNQRLGIHIFADNATLPNRGNNYLIWFRQATNVVDIIKVTNDALITPALATFPIPALTNNTNYNFKVVADRITGKLVIYINNAIIGTYTDNSVINGGQFISFRNGDSKISISDIKVSRSRLANTATITVGSPTTKNVHYNNPNPLTPACKLVSINSDLSNNLSTETSKIFKIDFTNPSTIATVNDGTGLDIQFTSNLNSLSANWTTSSDINSDVVDYQYAVGTSSTTQNILPFTSNGVSTTATINGLNLTLGLTYYIHVKAINGAGLTSLVTVSNGVTVNSSVGIPENDLASVSLLPNPANTTIDIISNDYIKFEQLEIFSVDGKLILFTNFVPNKLDVSSIANGLYFLKIQSNIGTIQKRLIILHHN